MPAAILKYLRRDSDNVIVGVAQCIGTWVTPDGTSGRAEPADWTGMVGAGYTEVDPPDANVPPHGPFGSVQWGIYDQPHDPSNPVYRWKIEGSPDAWVAVAEGDKTAAKIAESKTRRGPEMAGLKGVISNEQAVVDEAQAVIDDGGASQAEKDSATERRDQAIGRRDAVQAVYNTHVAEWENVWTEGTNP